MCHFCHSYLKANKVSKNKGQAKLNMRIISKSLPMLLTKNYQNYHISSINSNSLLI